MTKDVLVLDKTTNGLIPSCGTYEDQCNFPVQIFSTCFSMMSTTFPKSMEVAIQKESSLCIVEPQSADDQIPISGLKSVEMKDNVESIGKMGTLTVYCKARKNCKPKRTEKRNRNMKETGNWTRIGEQKYTQPKFFKNRHRVSEILQGFHYMQNGHSGPICIAKHRIEITSIGIRPRSWSLYRAGAEAKEYKIRK